MDHETERDFVYHCRIGLVAIGGKSRVVVDKFGFRSLPLDYVTLKFVQL